MNILVWGGTGLIGRPLVRTLESRGHGVDVHSRGGFRQGVFGPGGIGAIVHLAQPDDPANEPEACWDLYIGMTRDLAVSANAHGALFVFASSGTADARHSNPSLRYKAAGEIIARDAKRHLIVRPWYVYGDGVRPGSFFARVKAGTEQLGDIKPLHAEDAARRLASAIEADATGELTLGAHFITPDKLRPFDINHIKVRGES